MKLLFKANRRLNKAYLLKESFGQLWDYKRPGWARRFFEHWKDALKWQRLKPFEKFAPMVEAHWDGIESYCQEENKVPLGFVEGINNKIRAFNVGPTASRRGVPPPQDPHLHVAEVLKITHTIP